MHAKQATNQPQNTIPPHNIGASKLETRELEKIQHEIEKLQTSYLEKGYYTHTENQQHREITQRLREGGIKW